MPCLGQKSIKFFTSKYLRHFNFLKWSKISPLWLRGYKNLLKEEKLQDSTPCTLHARGKNVLLQQFLDSLVQEQLMTASRAPAKPVFISLLYWLGFAPKRLRGVQSSPHSRKAELPFSHVYLKKEWDSPLLPWHHRGIFNASVGDAAFSAIISTWHKHCWGWSSAQQVEGTVWSAGHWEAYFFLWGQDTSVFHPLQKGRCMRKKYQKNNKTKSSPLRLHGIARGRKQTTFFKIPLW